MPPTLPVFGYGTTNAFGSLTFSGPVAIVSAPGETNRYFFVFYTTNAPGGARRGNGIVRLARCSQVKG